jgi:hypothetical protein
VPIIVALNKIGINSSRAGQEELHDNSVVIDEYGSILLVPVSRRKKASKICAAILLVADTWDQGQRIGRL